MLKRLSAYLLMLIGVCMIIGAFTAQKGMGYGLVCILIGGAFCIAAYFVLKTAKKSGSGIILKTKIVDTCGKTSMASAAVRGTVGSVVAGPVGAIVGASTAKNNRKTTFLIIYEDGKKKTVTVPNHSFEYQRYIKYLE